MKTNESTPRYIPLINKAVKEIDDNLHITKSVIKITEGSQNDYIN